MGTLVDHKGKRFGLLVGVRFACRRRGRTLWLLRCDCGRMKVIDISNVVSRGVDSCGCKFRAGTSRRRTTHGLSQSGTYRSWHAMLRRCQVNLDYVTRGISVCDRWRGRNGFANFHADLGLRPEGMTLERRDNDVGYCPENCRWATRAEQNRNTRANVRLTFRGKTLVAAEWARLSGVDPKTLRQRIYRGKPIEEILKEYVAKESPCKTSRQAKPYGGRR